MDEMIDRFKKKDIIKHSGKFYECIISDEEIAVFGKLTKWDEKNHRVSYRQTFIVSQTVRDGFEYELVQHHKVRVIPDADGGL